MKLTFRITSTGKRPNGSAWTTDQSPKTLIQTTVSLSDHPLHGAGVPTVTRGPIQLNACRVYLQKWSMMMLKMLHHGRPSLRQKQRSRTWEGPAGLGPGIRPYCSADGGRWFGLLHSHIALAFGTLWHCRCCIAIAGCCQHSEGEAIYFLVVFLSYSSCPSVTRYMSSELKCNAGCPCNR